MKPKHPTSFRISDEARTLLQQLSDRLHVSKPAVIEMALRELAVRYSTDFVHALNERLLQDMEAQSIPLTHTGGAHEGPTSAPHAKRRAPRSR